MFFCRGLGMEAIVCDRSDMIFDNKNIGGVLLQYPDTEGNIYEMAELIERAHTNGVGECERHSLHIGY